MKTIQTSRSQDSRDLRVTIPLFHGLLHFEGDTVSCMICILQTKCKSANANDPFIMAIMVVLTATRDPLTALAPLPTLMS